MFHFADTGSSLGLQVPQLAEPIPASCFSDALCRLKKVIFDSGAASVSSYHSTVRKMHRITLPPRDDSLSFEIFFTLFERLSVTIISKQDTVGIYQPHSPLIYDTTKISFNRAKVIFTNPSLHAIKSLSRVTLALFKIVYFGCVIVLTLV